MLNPETMNELINYLIFGSLAFIILASAIMVITRKEVVHSALFLILCFFGVAGLYIQLRAQFLAAVQILVYAGGIMVLYLFVILLVNRKVIEETKRSKSFKKIFILVGLVLLLEFVLIFTGTVLKEGVKEKIVEESFNMGSTEYIGGILYTKFLFPFELVSLVLLAAMIGAIVLSKRKI